MPLFETIKQIYCLIFCDKAEIGGVLVTFNDSSSLIYSCADNTLLIVAN